MTHASRFCVALRPGCWRCFKVLIKAQAPICTPVDGLVLLINGWTTTCLLSSVALWSPQPSGSRGSAEGLLVSSPLLCTPNICSITLPCSVCCACFIPLTFSPGLLGLQSAALQILDRPCVSVGRFSIQVWIQEEPIIIES